MDIRAFIEYVMRLKGTTRTGWNLQFPPNSPFRSREVNNAESVAAHSYGLVMWAMLLAPKLGVDQLKLMKIALLHDLAEAVTGDRVLHHLTAEDKVAAVREKRQLENETMRTICATLGSEGDEYYQLWQEFFDQTSPEGIIITQLDLLEVAFQAVQYWRDGHTLNPWEFFANVRHRLKHPAIIAQFVALEDELRRLEAQRID